MHFPASKRSEQAIERESVVIASLNLIIQLQFLNSLKCRHVGNSNLVFVLKLI